MFYNFRTYRQKSQLFARVFSHGENHESDLPTTSRGLMKFGKSTHKLFRIHWTLQVQNQLSESLKPEFQQTAVVGWSSFFCFNFSFFYKYRFFIFNFYNIFFTNICNSNMSFSLPIIDLEQKQIEQKQNFPLKLCNNYMPFSLPIIDVERKQVEKKPKYATKTLQQ